MPAGECDVAWTIDAADGEDGADGRVQLHGRSTTPSPATDAGHHGRQRGTTAATTVDRDDGSDAGAELDDVIDASEVSDGATWLGRVLSIARAGRAVRLARADRRGVAGRARVHPRRALPALGAGSLTLVGTLLYVVALSAAVNGRLARQRRSTRRAWLDLFDAGWAGQRRAWPGSCSSSPAAGSCCARSG